MTNLKIKPNTTLLEAMKLMNNIGERCLIVVDKKNKLLGTLTDGDLRRRFLSGADFKSKVEKVFNKKPTFVIRGKYILKTHRSRHLVHNRRRTSLSYQANSSSDNNIMLL